MGLKVFWSTFAENRLVDIYNYYKFKVSVKVAKRLVNQLVESTLGLRQFPEMGQKEPLLDARNQEFRYLISGNYKIVYWIDHEFGRVVIATLFDTRQNPEKLLDEVR